MRALLAWLAVAAAGCGGTAATMMPADDCLLDGDAPAIELLVRDVAGVPNAVAAGDAVPLIAAPQGGFVLLAGARARGLDGCALQLQANVADPSSGRIVALESRPVLLVPGDGGWGMPNQPETLSNYTNLAMCPNAALARDFTAPYVLTVEARDRSGRSASASAPVLPTCAALDGDDRAACECSCRPHHALGDGC